MKPEPQTANISPLLSSKNVQTPFKINLEHHNYDKSGPATKKYERINQSPYKDKPIFNDYPENIGQSKRHFETDSDIADVRYKYTPASEYESRGGKSGISSVPSMQFGAMESDRIALELTGGPDIFAQGGNHNRPKSRSTSKKRRKKKVKI